MDKKNYWVIALMAALAIGLLAAITLLRPSGGQSGEIVVTVDGAEYARVPRRQQSGSDPDVHAGGRQCQRG